MRITRDYGLTSSKLEHDLLARLDRDIARGCTISAEKKHSANKAVINGCSSERRRYTHVWKENLNNDY